MIDLARNCPLLASFLFPVFAAVGNGLNGFYRLLVFSYSIEHTYEILNYQCVLFTYLFHIPNAFFLNHACRAPLVVMLAEIKRITTAHISIAVGMAAKEIFLYPG